jgi:hypothetical protein
MGADDYESMRRDYERMRDAERNKIIDEAVAELSRLTTLRPLSELTAAAGEVLLWWDDGGRIRPVGFIDRNGSDDDRYAIDRDGDYVSLVRPDHYFTPLPKARKPAGAR